MRFVITGDSLFSSRNLSDTIDPKVRQCFAEADAAFTNAEFTTPRKHTVSAAGRGYQTSVRPETLKEFARLNIRYVGFANNHTGDFGPDGIMDTLEEARDAGLIPLGIGEDLYEARKPYFIDTRSGRIAIITVGITRSEVFAASYPGNGVPGRPGLNPLRWKRLYEVSREDFEQLREIASHIGIAQSMEIGKKIETFKPGPGNQLDFGSLFEGYITFEYGEEPRVKTIANENDQNEIMKWIRDARNRADFVFVNIHTHEGRNENWYDDYAPEFVEKFAHEAVDNGADCVFGHGAHFTRGAELYGGKPIFYNLGSLMMEFQAGESIITPEMYASYGYKADEVPSTLHDNRAKDGNGNWQGFYSDRKFSENFMVSFDMDRDSGRFDYEILPISLNLTDRFVTKRGLPVMADSSSRKYLIDRLDAISRAKYSTAVTERDGHIILEKA